MNFAHIVGHTRQIKCPELDATHMRR